MDTITTVRLVRFDNSRNNQLTFETLERQTNFFNNLPIGRTFTNCSYQDRSGSMRIKGYIETLRSYNYGFYENEYNGVKKRFYFWVLGMEYLNRDTTQVIIALDVMQTWYFNINFKPCVIERYHTKNDSIGMNTYPESFELGDYVTNKQETVGCMQNDVGYILAIADPDNINGRLVGGLYSGLTYIYYRHNDYILLSRKIEELCKNGKADCIAMIFSFPNCFNDIINLVNEPESGNEIEVSALTHGKISFETNAVLNGYTPKNNKLYCYPYNFVSVENSKGENVILKAELCSNSFTFDLDTTVTPNPIFSLVPLGYNGEQASYINSIEEQSFGLCSWNNDNYGNWYAQNSNSIKAGFTNAERTYSANNAVNRRNYNTTMDIADNNAKAGIVNTTANTVGNVIGLNLGGAVGSALSGGVNSALNYANTSLSANSSLQNAQLMNRTNYENTITSALAQLRDSSIIPNTVKGDTSANGLDLVRKTSTFFIKQKCIKREYLEIIDNYFSMYGYKVNSLDNPRLYINGRKNWNYIKTLNCICLGGVPADDLREIENIFNEGITFWHNYNTMYDYSQNNNII